jgi:NAD(P)-dependent dehydrogenase (short-subunit alcohol dehydrogenase family)
VSTVWITGGGSGIGKALALSFATDGWDVVISGRNHKRLQEVCNLSPQIRAVDCDITNEADVLSAQPEIGAIDMAVLNAGDYRPGPTHACSPNDHRKIFEVNYFGTLNCIQAVLPEMRKHGGKLAIVGSLAGYIGLPNASAYGPSKAALISLCESLCAELQDSLATIRLINPGFVKSTLTDKNDFEMQYLLTAEQAAIEIRRGLEGDSFEIAFPGPFVRRMKLLQMIPYRLYFYLARKMTRQR